MSELLSDDDLFGAKPKKLLSDDDLFGTDTAIPADAPPVESAWVHPTDKRVARAWGWRNPDRDAVSPASWDDNDLRAPSREDKRDDSTALGDLEAGIKQLQMIFPAFTVSGGVSDINAGTYDVAVAESQKDKLSRIDARLAEIEKQLGINGAPKRALSRDQRATFEERRPALEQEYIELKAARGQLTLAAGYGGPEASISEGKQKIKYGAAAIASAAPDLKKLAEESAAIPMNPSAEAFGNADSLAGMWAAFANDPTGTSRTFVLRSLPASAPAIIAGIVGQVGGPGGAAAMAGLAGGSVEMGSSVAQDVTQALIDQKVDVNDPKAVEAWALENMPQLLEIIGKARTRAAIIAPVDAITGGVGGRIAEKVGTSSAARKVVGGVIGSAVDAAGGGAGEAGAQLATQNELSLGDIGAEVVGGIAPGAAMVGGQIAVESAKTAKSTVSTGNTAPDAELALKGATAPATAPSTAPAESAETAVAPDAKAALEDTTKDKVRRVLEARKKEKRDPTAEEYEVSGRTTPASAPASDLSQEERLAANREGAAATGVTARPIEPVTPAGNPEPTPDAGLASGPEVSELQPEEAPVSGAPATEPAPQSPQTPEAAGDTIETVPETPDTLEAQGAALVDPKSKRKAVFVPYETYNAGEVAEPEGKTIGRVVLPEGVLFYNKTKGFTANDIRTLYKVGKLGQVLGLGNFTKADAAASAAKGNKTVAVTERTPKGVEVKAAAGTTETAPEQLAQLEAQADEGNTVQVEEPAKVIDERLAGRSVKGEMTPEQIAEIEARYGKPKPEAPVAPAAPVAPKAEEAKAVSKARSEPTEAPLPKSRTEVDPKTGKRVTYLEPTAAEKARIKEAEDRAAAARSVSSGAEIDTAEREAALERADRGEVASPEEELRIRRTGQTKDQKRESAAVENATKTQALMEDMAPKELENVRSLRDAAFVYERLKRTLDEAKKRGIAIAGKVKDAQTNAQAWLASVKTMAGKLEKLETMKSAQDQADVMAQVASFLANEALLTKVGDASGLRAARIEEGAAGVRTGASQETPDIGDTTVDEGMNPEEALIAKEESEEGVSETEEDPEDDEDDAGEIQEFEVGDRAVWLSDDGREIVTIASMSVRDGKTFYRVRTASGETESVPADRYQLFKLRATKQIGSDQTSSPAGDAAPEPSAPKAPPVVEVRKKRTINKPVTSGGNTLRSRMSAPSSDYHTEVQAAGATMDAGGVPYNDLAEDEQQLVMGNLGTNTPERHFASEVMTIAEMRDNLLDPAFRKDARERGGLNTSRAGFNSRQRGLMDSIAKAILDVMVSIAPDVKVYVLPEAQYHRFEGDQSYGYYNADGDYIVVPESAANNSSELLHILMHEMGHAAFDAALRMNPKLKEAVTLVAKRTKAWADANIPQDQRPWWYANVFRGDTAGPFEFVTEAFSNPAFQELLSKVPVSYIDGIKLGINLIGLRKKVVTVMDWVRAQVAQVFNLEGALRAAGIKPDTPTALDLMMKIADNIIAVAPQARADFFSQNPGYAAISPLSRMAKGDPLAKRLEQRGLTGATAADIMAVVNEEFDGNVTDEDLDAIAITLGQRLAVPADFSKMVPPVPPKVIRALEGAGNPKGFTKASRLRRMLLGVQTLDYIVRRYKGLFGDKKGNALEDFERAMFEYDPVKRAVEERHNQDFAAFEELRRKDPEQAAAMAGLITELAPFDVNLGPGADNSHLGNGKAHLQAKARLPELEAAFRALKPETQDLLLQMAERYRGTHNEAVYGVIYNLLGLLEPRLSNSNLMHLVEAAYEGRLTEADKELINNDVIYQALLNSQELQRRKGLYFPSTRFGDHVVTTRAKITPPGFSSVTTKSKKTVPVKVEVDNEAGTVRFIMDDSVRGSKAALGRAVDKYIREHDMTMSMHRVKYRDRLLNEFVTKSGQGIGREYDYAIELRFQNEGVHFFEDAGEAEKFSVEAKKSVTSGELIEASEAMIRRNTHDIGAVLKGSAAEALMRSFDARNDKENGGTNRRRQEALALLQQIVAQQMPGNRYEKRLLKRRNVKGFSDEVGRAAAHYGRSAGSYMAAIQTGPARHDALDRMLEIERNSERERPAVNEVLNELRKRHEALGQDVPPNRFINDLVTINGMDKLASIANWIINGTQVVNNTLPLLGGRFGNAKASAALIAAYGKVGAHGIIGRGIRNLGVSVTQAGKYELDTSDVVGSVQKRLGPKYKDLMERLIEQGDIAADVGIENAAALSSGRGVWGTVLAKMDRIVRQMPNAVEVLNRSVSAVAAYDLARKAGQGHQAAIEFAIDTLRQSQGRYDAVNAPVFMQKSGLLRFALVFKKYAQLQYQLLGDMFYRAFKDASPAERAAARKQFATLMTINLTISGVFGLPLLSEAVKLAFTVGALAFGTDDWEEEQRQWRETIREAVGKDWEQVISKGALSKLLDIDLQSRMGWQDLLTGFQPRDLNRDGWNQYIGTLVLGAPGGMVGDWIAAGENVRDGDWAKAFQNAFPLKQAVDSSKALSGYSSGKLDAGDAVRQFIGFRSLRQAEKGDAKGAAIAEAQAKDKARKKLMSRFINARTTAEIQDAKRAIDEFNAALPKDSRERIGLKGLNVLRKKAIREEQAD